MAPTQLLVGKQRESWNQQKKACDFHKEQPQLNLWCHAKQKANQYNPQEPCAVRTNAAPRKRRGGGLPIPFSQFFPSKNKIQKQINNKNIIYIYRCIFEIPGSFHSGIRGKPIHEDKTQHSAFSSKDLGAKGQPAAFAESNGFGLESGTNGVCTFLCGEV